MKDQVGNQTFPFCFSFFEMSYSSVPSFCLKLNAIMVLLWLNTSFARTFWATFPRSSAKIAQVPFRTSRILSLLSHNVIATSSVPQCLLTRWIGVGHPILQSKDGISQAFINIVWNLKLWHVYYNEITVIKIVRNGTTTIQNPDNNVSSAKVRVALWHLYIHYMWFEK